MRAYYKEIDRASINRIEEFWCHKHNIIFCSFNCGYVGHEHAAIEKMGKTNKGSGYGLFVFQNYIKDIM